MEKKIHLAVGSVVGWEGKKYKLVSDSEVWGCSVCDLSKSCPSLPFDCTLVDGLVHFEEIGGEK